MLGISEKEEKKGRGGGEAQNAVQRGARGAEDVHFSGEEWRTAGEHEGGGTDVGGAHWREQGVYISVCVCVCVGGGG